MIEQRFTLLQLESFSASTSAFTLPKTVTGFLMMPCAK